MGDTSILAAELGAPAPAELGAVADSDLGRFAASVKAAKDKRQADIEAAITEALQLLPGMLRGPVRKALGLS